MPGAAVEQPEVAVEPLRRPRSITSSILTLRLLNGIIIHRRGFSPALSAGPDDNPHTDGFSAAREMPLVVYAPYR